MLIILIFSIPVDNVKEINVKNCAYCFFYYTINIEDLEPRNIKKMKGHTKMILYTKLGM